MTRKDEPKGPKKRDIEKIERVEELYRQADWGFGGFREPDQPPLDTPGSEGRGNDDPGEEPDDLSWVLGVLEDLAAFAEDRQLPEMEDCLREAHRKVAAIIDATDTH